MPSNVKLVEVRVVAVEAEHTESDAVLITGAFDAAMVARAILPSDREGFVAIHLDARQRVRSIELVSVGSLNSSIVSPREVFKAAILANAAAIIVAHNHPSGDPEPSGDDISATKRLVDVGILLGIPVVDSLVVTDNAAVSMDQRGLGGLGLRPRRRGRK